MKRRGSIVVLWAAAAALAVMPMAMGCGGGGSSPISYDGIETQSSVAGSTAGAFLTNGYNGVDVASVLGGTLVSQGAMLVALAAESMPQDLPTIVSDEMTVDCDNDGFFTFDYTVNTITWDFTGTLSYEGCSPRPGESISGNADAVGSGFSMFGPPDETELTFTNMTIVKWGETWKASGDMTVENVIPEFTSAAVPLLFREDAVITIDEIILKSPDGITMKLTWADIFIDLGEGNYFVGISGLGGKGARFFHPDLGYLYLANYEPIGVNDETGMPFIGGLRIMDESSTDYAWLRFGTNPGGTYWQLWLDGGNQTPDFNEGIEADDTPVAQGTFEGGEFIESVPD